MDTPINMTTDVSWPCGRLGGQSRHLPDERALRGIALGRKAWLFAGSPRGGERAAFMYSLIVTTEMNDVDP